MKKRVAMLISVVIMIGCIFAGFAYGKQFTNATITMIETPLEVSVFPKVSYDGISITVVVEDWDKTTGATFSFNGDKQSIGGVTEMIRSKRVLLDSKKSNKIVLESMGTLHANCDYEIILKYSDWDTHKKRDFAIIKFKTLEIPVVDVETGDCQDVTESSFKVCANVKSTGIFDDVYLNIEVANNKETLEKNDYKEILIFQYDQKAKKGEHVLEANNLQEGKKYFYRIVADNGSGNDIAEIKEVTTLTP